MPSRRSKTAPAPAATHLARQAQWSGLSEGDPVDVLDARERGASWAFVAHVTNTETSAEWVEVVGGRAGDTRRRSVRPEQLFPHKSIRAGTPTTPPICEAPRLALS